MRAVGEHGWQQTGGKANNKVFVWARDGLPLYRLLVPPNQTQAKCSQPMRTPQKSRVDPAREKVVQCKFGALR